MKIAHYIVTGRNPLYYTVKNSILERLAGRPVLETFIRSIRETDPMAAAELQALLNETWSKTLRTKHIRAREIAGLWSS